MILRLLIFLHRWVGVVLSILFLVWFPSGIGMMYWGYPEVSPADRLEHSPKLDPAKIKLSPQEAATVVGASPAPGQIRLNSYDGRPAYRISDGGKGPSRIVYADTGEEQKEVSAALRDRIAAAWTGLPSADAHVEPVEVTDQWTVSGRLARLRPLYKYSWPNGEHVYVAGATGQVEQYTTWKTRVLAHLSAIPHWVYYTPLRSRPAWLTFMIWTSGIGTIGAILGVVIGVCMYSPSKKYRLNGKPTGIPYRGQKRWHTIFGLVFGIATVTWTFSGLLSLEPFPSLQGEDKPGRSPQEIAAALRGSVGMEAFADVHPRDLLLKNPGLDIREIAFTSFAGMPVASTQLGGGATQMLSIAGSPIPEFDRAKIVEVVKTATENPPGLESRIVEQYDNYYLDRTRERPLPVVLVLTHDENETRYYIDPKTARLVGGYSNQNWVGRWLYNGLHSLNFPWLYNYRPLWDIVVITFMLGGTTLCVTSLVLAWRVLGRKLRILAKAPDDLLVERS